MSDSEYIIFISNGLPEKDLMGTSVVRSIKENWPNRKIIVLTRYPEIWLHNPDVFRFYKISATPYFYDDYIKEKNTLVFAQDPYQSEDFIYQRKHLIEIWCEMCGVRWNGQKPSLYFTEREKEIVQKILQFNKPLFFIQPNSSVIKDINFCSWVRNIPLTIAQRITNLANKKGYQVIHLKMPNEPLLANAIYIKSDFRLVLCSLGLSDKRLLSDSYAQHVATALGLQSVVLWITSNPKVAGYDSNINISIKVSDKEKKKIIDSYCPVYDLKKTVASLEIRTADYFNEEEIINQLKL